MSLSPAELAVLGTIGGAIAGGAFSTIAVIVTRRSEERTQFRKLVVEAAVTNWKALFEHTTARGGQISPLSDFIVHATKVCELALSGNLDASNAKAELAKINALMSVLSENASAVTAGTAYKGAQRGG
jgi:hypothetical protein